jgi:hypothetical protein
MRIALGGAGALALALMVGCGGGEEIAQPKQQRSMGQARSAPLQDGENRPPVVERVEISPRLATTTDTLVVKARASDPDGDPVTLRYEWSVNGQPVSTGEKLAAGSAPRDSRVVVSVVAEDAEFASEPMTEEVEVVAAVPQVEDVTFEPAEPAPGDDVTALVNVGIQDDSRLELRYRWLVNDKPTGVTEKVFSTKGLRRGDKLSVEIVARDGDVEAPPWKSAVLSLGNAPPKIKGIPAAVKSGDAFTYQFEAEDADGDASLRYSLEKAPAGMTIDPIYGLATWRPTADQAGSQDIEVVVKDSAGGTGKLSFTVSVSAAAPEAAAKDGAAKPAEAPPAKPAELKFSDDPDEAAEE